MSTLLPITPPRMPPAAAPMMPPLTLSLLVVAPMMAPAAAPIAASRLVFFSVTVRGSEAATFPPLELVELPEEDDDVRRWVVVVRAGVEPVRRGRGTAAAARARPLRRIEHSRLTGLRAGVRSFSAWRQLASLLHAAAKTNAGARKT